MPIIDIIILIIILASAIWGIFKGFVSQLVSILALILGAWCAFKFSSYCATELKNSLSLAIAQSTLHIIIFIIILVLVIIIGYFIGKGIEGIIKLSMLDWLNRLLGFFFAAFKTIMILSLIAYIINYTNNLWDFIPKDMLSGSKGYKFLTDFSTKVFPYLQSILK